MQNRPDPAARSPTPVVAWDGARPQPGSDWVAVERALEIHIAGAPPLVTMRTPGHDAELAAGLLHGEGVVREAADIVAMRQGASEPDVLRVLLRAQARERLPRLQRSGLMNSACGVCGRQALPPLPLADESGIDDTLRLQPDWLLGLPAQLRAAQEGFDATGSLHAAGLFAAGGRLLALREDVGRHNALDKLVGHALLQGQLPWRGQVLVLSGRASHELLQKAVQARVPVVCAISAPSSQAIALADRYGITLVGFIRAQRFKVYSGAGRLGWD